MCVRSVAHTGGLWAYSAAHPARPCYLLSHVCMFIITKPLPRLKLGNGSSAASARARCASSAASAERDAPATGARGRAESCVCERPQDSEVPRSPYTARPGEPAASQGEEDVPIYTFNLAPFPHTHGERPTIYCSHASTQRDKEVKVQPQWVHHQQALARQIRGEQPAARRKRGPCGAERANDNGRRVC